jgi:hypothetical protein
MSGRLEPERGGGRNFIAETQRGAEKLNHGCTRMDTDLTGHLAGRATELQPSQVKSSHLQSWPRVRVSLARLLQAVDFRMIRESRNLVSYNSLKRQ